VAFKDRRFMARPHWHQSRGRYFVAVDFEATVDETLVCLSAQNAYRPRPSLIICSVTWFMDRFIPWAVLDMWVGRFGCSCGPFWIWPWAVLHISKIYGPFWSGPFWFMGRFGIDP